MLTLMMLALLLARPAAPVLPAVEPHPPFAIATDLRVVRLDTFHVRLGGARVFRIESTGTAPFVPERFVFYRRPDGKSITFYGVEGTIIALDPGERYSFGWYAGDAIHEFPQGSLRMVAIAADVNLDGGVTIEDLLMYRLDLYDAGDPRADLDDGTGTGTHDGGVGIEDLLYFLAAYGAGGNAPPSAP